MATKSTIFAQEDVTIISSGGIVNAGSIAGNNVTLTAADNIINKNFSDITALNDLSITSTVGSISNFSNLTATNALTLTAAQDITNSATILTNAKNLLDSGNDAYVKNNSNSSNSGNISSTLIETAGINAGTLTINAGNNFNNYAANITTTGNAEITAGNDATFSSLELRNRTETYWGHKSDGGSKIVDTTTNAGSNINIAGNLDVVATGLSTTSSTDGGSNINVIGSNISTDGNLTLAAKDQVNIISAIDTYHKEIQTNKKGLTYSKSYFATTDTTTNVSSNFTSANDITITSGKDTNILASNLTGTGNGNITVGAYTDFDSGSSTYGQTLFNDDANLNILNSVDTQRFYSESTKTKMGLSAENGLMTAIMVAALVAMGPASLGMVALAGAGGGAVGAVNKQKTTETILRYDETIIGSNLNFGNDLTISSMNDTTIQASKLEVGGDLTINTVNNLTIATANETHQKTHDIKDKGNYFFKNGNSGTYRVNVINTEITSNGGDNTNLIFNIGNASIGQYNQDDRGNSTLAYLEKLDSSSTLYNPVEEIAKSWSQTTRGLTDAGQAVVAITATALTAGAMNPINGSVLQGALVAGGSAAASTASIAAVNSSMNADGNLLKQLETISSDTWDKTTSKESVKNIIIAAAAGGLTVGITNFIDTGSFTTAANTTNTISTSSNALERISTNLTNSFQEVATQTLASTAAQSAINGDSFVDSLKNQGKNILIYTVAKVGANEIGRAYHGTETSLTDSNGNTLTNLDGSVMTSPQISKLTQLTLHAGLGCGIGAASGGDCGSGAIAGVVGELTAETAFKNGAGRDTSIQLANLMGGISAGTYGNLTGQSDKDNANNIWTGSRIGQNAAENNYFYRKIFGKKAEEDLDKFFSNLRKNSLDNTADKFVASNELSEKAGLFPILVVGQGLLLLLLN